MNAMLRKRLTPILLIGCLGGLSACVPSGSFCTVVRAPIVFAPSTAEMVVRTDRPAAEALDAQNAYGRANCEW